MKKRTLEKINEDLLRMIQLWPALDLYQVPQYEKLSKEYQVLLKKVTNDLFPTMELLIAAKMFDIPYKTPKSKYGGSYEIESVCVNGGFQLNTPEWSRECEKEWYKKPKKKNKKKKRAKK